MSASDPNVRPASRKDEQAIRELWLSLQQSQGAMLDLVRPSEDAATRWVNDFRAWVESELRCVVVAELEGEVVGFAAAQPWYPPPIYVPASEVLITALYVAEKHRREGVGTALVDAVRAWAVALPADRVRLEVVRENEAGLAFWKSLDAREVSATLVLEAGSAGEAAPGK